MNMILAPKGPIEDHGWYGCSWPSTTRPLQSLLFTQTTIVMQWKLNPLPTSHTSHMAEFVGRAKPKVTEVVEEVPDYQGPSMRELTKGSSAINAELSRLEAMGGEDFLYGTVLPVRLRSACPAAQDAVRAALHEDYKLAELYLDQHFEDPYRVGAVTTIPRTSITKYQH